MAMNRYLMSVERYFSGEETFAVSAENKEGALIEGRRRLDEDPNFNSGGNYKRDTLRVVKKMKSKEAV